MGYEHLRNQAFLKGISTLLVVNVIVKALYLACCLKLMIALKIPSRDKTFFHYYIVFDAMPNEYCFGGRR